MIQADKSVGPPTQPILLRGMQRPRCHIVGSLFLISHQLCAIHVASTPCSVRRNAHQGQCPICSSASRHVADQKYIHYPRQTTRDSARRSTPSSIGFRSGCVVVIEPTATEG
jgi:hypothetical protein